MTDCSNEAKFLHRQQLKKNGKEKEYQQEGSTKEVNIKRTTN